MSQHYKQPFLKDLNNAGLISDSLMKILILSKMNILNGFSLYLDKLWSVINIHKNSLSNLLTAHIKLKMKSPYFTMDIPQLKPIFFSLPNELSI